MSLVKSSALVLVSATLMSAILFSTFRGDPMESQSHWIEIVRSKTPLLIISVVDDCALAAGVSIFQDTAGDKKIENNIRRCIADNLNQYAKQKGITLSIDSIRQNVF